MGVQSWEHGHRGYGKVLESLARRARRLTLQVAVFATE